jgi:arylsulfatase A-like enzyme
MPLTVLVAVLIATVSSDRLAAQQRDGRRSGALNVVMIVVDDLGWADLAYTGHRFHESPRIDQFSKQSLSFTQAYAAAPVCSPTRAALLTGKSPARLHMTVWHEGAVHGGPADRPLRDALSIANLPLEEITIAERFREQGYQTAHIGKWHLGTAAHYPEAQGFDWNVGGTFWGAPATFFAPFRGPWSASDPEFRYVPGLMPSAQGAYLPDRLTDEAIRFLRQTHGQPFFLNLWFYSVHSPIEAPPSLVDYFRTKPGKDPTSDATYAAMVARMDANVGRVLEVLREIEQYENTVVMVTSDNGGLDIPARGITPTINRPLRSGKGTLYEGGLRVPLLIRWPGRTSEGDTCPVPVTSEDFYATFAEAFEWPSDSVERDGISLLPLLDRSRNKHVSDWKRQTLYWHFPHYYPRMTPASAVRDGTWKLIHYYEQDRVELYDLATNPEETNDLSDREPERVGQLLAKLNTWRHLVRANAPQPTAP